MAVEFKELINLKPIATSRQKFARQAIIIQRRLAEVGNLDQVRQEALATINNTSIDDDPGEIKRLRLLYKEVYTQEELSLFINNTLTEMGFIE